MRSLISVGLGHSDLGRSLKHNLARAGVYVADLLLDLLSLRDRRLEHMEGGILMALCDYFSDSDLIISMVASL